MSNLEIDGVRYRVVEKRVLVGIRPNFKRAGMKTSSFIYTSPIYETIHVLEPIPYNAYKEKSDE